MLANTTTFSLGTCHQPENYKRGRYRTVTWQLTTVMDELHIIT